MKPVRLIKPAAILLVSAAVCLLGRVLFKAFFPDPRESAMAAAVIPGADVLLTFQPGRMAEEGFFDRFAPSPAHYRQAFGRARSGAGWQAAAGSLADACAAEGFTVHDVATVFVSAALEPFLAHLEANGARAWHAMPFLAAVELARPMPPEVLHALARKAAALFNVPDAGREDLACGTLVTCATAAADPHPFSFGLPRGGRVVYLGARDGVEAAMWRAHGNEAGRMNPVLERLRKGGLRKGGAFFAVALPGVVSDDAADALHWVAGAGETADRVADAARNAAGGRLGFEFGTNAVGRIDIRFRGSRHAGVMKDYLNGQLGTLRTFFFFQEKDGRARLVESLRLGRRGETVTLGFAMEPGEFSTFLSFLLDAAHGRFREALRVYY